MTEKEFHIYVKELFDYVPPEHRGISYVSIYSENEYGEDNIYFELCAQVEETQEEIELRKHEEIRLATIAHIESVNKLKSLGVWS